MALSGGLSNTSIQDLLQCLTEQRSDQAPRRRKRAGWSDGRREFGSVGDAVLTVLMKAGRDLTAHEIRLEAERLLGSPVSRHSVAYQLQKRSKGREPSVIQTGGRYYRCHSQAP